MKTEEPLDGVVSDGTFTNELLMTTFENSYFSIGFYSDSNFENLVTPTAGQVKVEGFDDINWHDIADGEFSAVDVYSATRAIPSTSGPLSKYRVTLTGVTGATHFKLLCRRY